MSVREDDIAGVAASAHGFWRRNLRREGLLLGSILLLFLIPNLWWVLTDRHVWPFDQASYGEQSTELWFFLRHHPREWYQNLIDMVRLKPPLLVWLGEFVVPIGVHAGSVEVALLIWVVFTQALTLALIWKAARHAAPVGIAAPLAALLLSAASPLFVGLTHQYFVEPLQGLIAAASLVLALYGPRLGAFRIFALLALAVTAAMCTKTTSFIYCGFFWCISAWTLLGKLAAREFSLRDPVAWVLIVIAAVFGAATLHWYIFNYHEMMDHIRASSTGPQAELYGRREPLWPKLGFWWRSGAAALFIWPPALLVLVLAGGAVSVLRVRGARPVSRAGLDGAVAAAALGHVLLTALLLASQPNEETRFLLALAPSISFLAAWTFADRRWRWPVAALSGLLLVQYLLVNIQALGGPVRSTAQAWLTVANPDRADRRLLEAVVLATCSPAEQYRYNIIGPEFPRMNANAASFFAAKDRLRLGYRCYYTSLGYAESDLHKAMQRVKEMNIDYLVFPKPAAIPKDLNPFNQVLRSAETWVSSSPEFHKTTTISQYDVFKTETGH